MNKKDVLVHINEVSFFEFIIYYMINWKTRKQVNLKNWITENDTLPTDLKSKVNYIKKLDTNTDKIYEVLKFVNDNITYTSDNVTWKVDEYWQTPKETWTIKKGDCEDGAILVYAIASYLGIPDYQIFIVASDVVGGGHCYLVYLSDEDGLEYPIDWCYWFDESYGKRYPYATVNNYFKGTCEWFRFNKSGHYKLWTK